MWTVVYIAPDWDTARNLERILAGEGILVKLRQLGKSRKNQAPVVEMLVPETEAEEAHEILRGSLGD